MRPVQTYVYGPFGGLGEGEREGGRAAFLDGVGGAPESDGDRRVVVVRDVYGGGPAFFDSSGECAKPEVDGFSVVVIGVVRCCEYEIS